MKKMMCGNSIVKACFYGLGVSMAIRTVYLDKEGNEVVKNNENISSVVREQYRKFIMK